MQLIISNNRGQCIGRHKPWWFPSYFDRESGNPQLLCSRCLIQPLLSIWTSTAALGTARRLCLTSSSSRIFKGQSMRCDERRDYDVIPGVFFFLLFFFFSHDAVAAILACCKAGQIQIPDRKVIGNVLK